MLLESNQSFNPADAADFIRMLNHVAPGVYQHAIKDALEAEMLRSPLFARAMGEAAAKAAADRLAEDEWLCEQAKPVDASEDIYF